MKEEIFFFSLFVLLLRAAALNSMFFLFVSFISAK